MNLCLVILTGTQEEWTAVSKIIYTKMPWPKHLQQQRGMQSCLLLNGGGLDGRVSVLNQHLDVLREPSTSSRGTLHAAATVTLTARLDPDDAVDVGVVHGSARLDTEPIAHVTLFFAIAIGVPSSYGSPYCKREAWVVDRELPFAEGNGANNRASISALV